MAKKKSPRRTQGAPQPNKAGMMQQIQQIQQQVLAAQEQLKEETVSASAGGVVEVTLTGDQRCTQINISPEVLEDGDHEMLQDLLITAFNNALEQSRQMAEERLGPLASGLSGLGLGL